MKSHFTSKFFSANRARLLELCDDAPIVIAANGLLQRGADSAYKFAQDANFWYLTGIDEADVVLVMDADEEYLILPGQSDYQKTFDSAAPGRELAARSGIKKIYQQAEGWERLGARLKKSKRAATVAPPPAHLEIYGMYTNPARAGLVKKLRTCQRGLSIKNVAPQLAQQRMIKQPEEIAAIQTAVDITAASLKDTFNGKYKYEYELEAEIAAGFRRRGAAGHAFEPIVAAGKRACTLHNVANNGAVEPGDLVVVDVGAEVEHYAADITRTISPGRPSARQRAVYEAVLAAQEFAIDLLKPDLEFNDYRQQTDHFIGEKLRQLGLIKTLNAKNIQRYYPHSISHFMGLNVHDVGDYGQPMQAGMALTVEPGIYIPEEGIGVRIEDDVLITEKGHQILSGKLPRRLG
jgi:Xaa-Pro aminopeptidase